MVYSRWVMVTSQSHSTRRSFLKFGILRVLRASISMSQQLGRLVWTATFAVILSSQKTRDESINVVGGHHFVEAISLRPRIWKAGMFCASLA